MESAEFCTFEAARQGTEGTAMTSVHQLFDLARLVKTERLNQGLTQSELAEQSGVSRRWLISFEQGDIEDARLSSLLKVLSKLGISLAATPTRTTSTKNENAQKDSNPETAKNTPLAIPLSVQTEFARAAQIVKSSPSYATALEKIRASNQNTLKQLNHHIVSLSQRSLKSDG